MNMDVNLLLKKLNILITSKPWIFFIPILIIGLYLRFYRIEEALSFQWDQGRDAFVVRDILHGKYTLIGPRTGVGHFHLGPIYYYLLVPFFYVTNLDPMASNYFNIIANIINFIILFVVTKKIFNNHAALFITLIYATSQYLMKSRVPWNVTLMPGIAALIFFSIIKVYQENYKWVFVAWTLSGFFFNLHFTAVFLPLIVMTSFIFVKDKIRVLKYSLLSLPLYFVWFLPNILYGVQNFNADYYRLQGFLRDYYIGFHLRFMLYRLPDSLIQFDTILNYPPISYLKFIIPVVFLYVSLFLGKEKKDRVFAYLISLWFIIPLIGFTIYGGPISDYYFLFSVPMVLFVLWYLLEKVLQLKIKPIYILYGIFLGLYIYYNTKGSWIKPAYGGLRAQKNGVRNEIMSGRKIDYEEGDIGAYLYTIWTEDGKRF